MSKVGSRILKLTTAINVQVNALSSSTLGDGCPKISRSATFNCTIQSSKYVHSFPPPSLHTIHVQIQASPGYYPSRARRRRLDRPTGVDGGRDDRVGGVSRGDGGERRDATAVKEAVDGTRGGLQRRVLDHAGLRLAHGGVGREGEGTHTRLSERNTGRVFSEPMKSSFSSIVAWRNTPTSPACVALSASSMQRLEGEVPQ